jgi:hypothetical protein
MTTYPSGTAFRRALEDRLAAQSLKTQMPLVRLRKLVVFDRFLARLVLIEPGTWLLKGGLVLQLRLSQHARTTKDMDLLSLTAQAEVPQLLTHAAHLDLQDWFSFAVRPDTATLPGPGHGGQRFFVTALVSGRTFESFHIDVGSGDPVIEPADLLETPPLLAFAGIPPVTIPCYPLTQHLAEKVHAYVRPRMTGESTRVKDLVDIILIVEHMAVSGIALRIAIQATFAAQGAGEPPSSLPAPPPSWSLTFRKLAEEVGLRCTTLAEAGQAAGCFLDPILGGGTQGVWSPDRQAWDCCTA